MMMLFDFLRLTSFNIYEISSQCHVENTCFHLNSRVKLDVTIALLRWETTCELLVQLVKKPAYFARAFKSGR